MVTGDALFFERAYSLSLSFDHRLMKMKIRTNFKNENCQWTFGPRTELCPCTNPL